jgi:hypothetical protein
VAEACDKMWPPIGLRAPPATKVIVAPGSAHEFQFRKSRSVIRKKNTTHIELDL